MWLGSTLFSLYDCAGRITIKKRDKIIKKRNLISKKEYGNIIGNI